MSNTEEKKIKGMAGNIAVYCAHDAILPLSEIVANPKNPNVHPADQITLLREIIKKQGWRSPIVISKQSGFVVKGHGRLMAAMDGDMEYAPVDYQDYESESVEYADMIADNRLAELSNMEPELLSELLEEMNEADFALTGYEEEEIKDILGQLLNEEEEAEEEEEIKRYFTPFVLAGDTWYIGEHRFIVGETDSAADMVIANYVYDTGNVGISCMRDGEEHSYIDLLRKWAEENDVTDEVFSAKKPIILKN